MDKKEKKIQKALGLLRKYAGYFKPETRATHYDVRTIRAVSPEAAQKCLSKFDGTLKFIVDETSNEVVWNNSQQP